MKEKNVLWPVKLFGWMAYLSSFLPIIVLTTTSEQFDSVFLVFAGLYFCIHFCMGLGVILQKHWGFKMMVYWWRFLLLGFPCGTILAVFALRYIKNNKIEFFYKRPCLLL